MGKQDVITFKVGKSLADSLRAIENRSQFIRDAVQAALENTCPLCRGSGIMTPEQRTHWQAFTRCHSIRQCVRCRAYHLVCEADPGQGAERRQ